MQDEKPRNVVLIVVPPPGPSQGPSASSGGARNQPISTSGVGDDDSLSRYASRVLVAPFRRQRTRGHIATAWNGQSRIVADPCRWSDALIRDDHSGVEDLANRVTRLGAIPIAWALNSPLSRAEGHTSAVWVIL